uniref:Uncharacterized protein n=1 Tax=Sinorhizobium kostiense TaxID=76747 RepID=A0ABS4QXH5_9HYPH|nr:hypothetical protein [Sinorhizobium kostiense]MBP2235353.1 hypothetical protein [Sinorhizobium kostiense]
MMKAIANALASLWRGALGVLNWTEQLIRWPFSVIFGSSGGGMPKPEYRPDVSATQLLDEFDEARARQAAVHDLDRDGVSTVLQYARALPSARSTIDLGGLKKDIRATLLTMDENELRALAQAGIGAVRKFIEGKPHGVHGVPVVKPVQQVAVPAPREMTLEERVLWTVRSKLLKEQSGQEFRIAR